MCEKVPTVRINHCCKLAACEHSVGGELFKATSTVYIYVCLLLPRRSPRQGPGPSCLMEKKGCDRTTPPITPSPPSLQSTPISCQSSTPRHDSSQCMYVCVCVCGRMACARVAIPSDCQRGSWEIYSTGQTTGFLYHFSRFLLFHSHSKKWLSQSFQSFFFVLLLLLCFFLQDKLFGLSSLHLHWACKCSVVLGF